MVELPKEVTRGITVEYKSDGDYEGHYVLFNHEDAIRHFVNFLGTAVYDAKPTIVD